MSLAMSFLLWFTGTVTCASPTIRICLATGFTVTVRDAADALGWVALIWKVVGLDDAVTVTSATPVAPVAAVASGGLVAKEKPRLRLLMAFAMLAYEVFLVHMAWATFLCAPTWETVEEILRPPQEQG